VIKIAAIHHYKNVTPPANIKLLIVTEAPPLPEENYFYNLSSNDHSHNSSRSFFRGIMQGIGLLSVGIGSFSERNLLDALLNEGYFVIDSCPVPLVDEQGNQLSSNKKKKIMITYTESLLAEITELHPEKILFVCSTNQIVIDNLKSYRYIAERLLYPHPLPYPGVGWLRRPDKKGFIDLLASDYRLPALY
jgi:hypothetical protein